MYNQFISMQTVVHSYFNTTNQQTSHFVSERHYRGQIRLGWQPLLTVAPPTMPSILCWLKGGWVAALSCALC